MWCIEVSVRRSLFAFEVGIGEDILSDSLSSLTGGVEQGVTNVSIVKQNKNK